MPQLLERKRDRQAHIRLSIASRVFLWGNYPITKPSTFVAICQRTSKPNAKWKLISWLC